MVELEYGRLVGAQQEGTTQKLQPVRQPVQLDARLLPLDAPKVVVVEAEFTSPETNIITMMLGVRWNRAKKGFSAVGSGEGAQARAQISHCQ